jgi:hypothetical protein
MKFTNFCIELDFLSLCEPFQPSVMFASKATAYQTQVLHSMVGSWK